MTHIQHLAEARLKLMPHVNIPRCLPSDHWQPMVNWCLPNHLCFQDPGWLSCHCSIDDASAAMHLLMLPVRRVIFPSTSSQSRFPHHGHLEPCDGSSGVTCPVDNLPINTDKNIVLQPPSSGGTWEVRHSLSQYFRRHNDRRVVHKCRHRTLFQLPIKIYLIR